MAESFCGASRKSLVQAIDFLICAGWCLPEDVCICPLWVCLGKVGAEVVGLIYTLLHVLD